MKYVGITKRDPDVRFREHLNSGTERAGLRYKPIETGFTLKQARIMEQNLIKKHGMIKNGGQLYNRINSISPKYWNEFGIQYFKH